MLSVFNALKAEYASREITMDDLERLQQYDFIRFENRGISRSERDCLLCEVRCEPFERFLRELTSAELASPEALRELIVGAGLELEESQDGGGAMLTFCSKDKCVEIVASVETDGKVSVDPDDIEGEPFFRVYLRVQGF